MKRYSLADYICSITSKDPRIQSLFGTISVGGEGSDLESMTIGDLPSMWSTTSYATGGWVHNKNLSKTGTLSFSLNQLSDKVAKFKALCNTFYLGDYEGFTLTLIDSSGNKIVTCTDCYIKGIPEQAFGSSAANQSWTFTCGKIDFN